jgi:hypothetical protein
MSWIHSITSPQFPVHETGPSANGAPAPTPDPVDYELGAYLAEDLQDAVRDARHDLKELREVIAETKVRPSALYYTRRRQLAIEDHLVGIEARLVRLQADTRRIAAKQDAIVKRLMTATEVGS